MSAPTKIHLGTCGVYCNTFAYGSTVPTTFAALKALCTADNRFGYLNDGATVTYSQEWFKAQDDTNTVTKSKMTSQSVVAAGDHHFIVVHPAVHDASALQGRVDVSADDFEG